MRGKKEQHILDRYNKEELVVKKYAKQNRVCYSCQETPQLHLLIQIDIHCCYFFWSIFARYITDPVLRADLFTCTAIIIIMRKIWHFLRYLNCTKHSLKYLFKKKNFCSTLLWYRVLQAVTKLITKCVHQTATNKKSCHNHEPNIQANILTCIK